MKKYLLSLITLSFLLCEASFTGGGMAFAATSYTLSSGTLTITGSGDMPTNYTSATSGTTAAPWAGSRASITKIVISEGVRSIGKYSFYGCSEATEVQIASTVTSIGQSAFQGCSKLDTVKFGTSTTYKCNIDTIYSGAFNSCYKVTSVYCYGSDAADAMARWLHIGFNAKTSNPFYDTKVSGSTKKFYLNSTNTTTLTTTNLSGATKIKQHAFYKSPLTSVTLPSTVKSIGANAFSYDSLLTTIKFGSGSSDPCGIDTIMSDAFSYCPKVKTVYCYGSNVTDAMARWLHIGLNAATSNPFNASTETSKTFYLYSSSKTSLSDSDFGDATTIKQFAFYNNTALKSVTFSNSITHIGKQAFKNCSNSDFKSITIPENVTVCGDEVFTGCSALTSVTWNAINCTQHLAGTTYTASAWPFYNNTLSGQITSFVFGANVEVVPPYICSKMSNLEYILSFAPTAPTVANANSFTNVNKSIPVVVTSADAIASYAGWSDFTNITTVLSGSCGDNATYALDFATGTLTISGTGAMTDYSTSDSNRSPWYKYNSYITDIVVSSGITALGNAAFANCDVETCTIPASVTNFVTQCFFGAKVNKLYYGGTLSQWCNITRGTNNPHPVTQKFYINSSEITSLTIPSITSLTAKAFMNMKGITAVTIPASITTIGADAFSGCSNIANVYYQGSLAQWCAINFSNDQEANPAFNGASLHIDDSDIDEGAVYVKDAITSIGNYAFCGVTNYTSIDINAATTVGVNTFKNCTAQILYRGSASGTSGTVSWTWADGVLTLSGSGAMNNYTSAANVPWTPYMASTNEIIVQNGITSIGNYAFNSPAASPVTVTLPSTGLTTIGNSSFSGLTALRELTIPNGVTNIGTNAFSSCTNLEKIYCPSTVPTLTNAAGGGYTVYNSFASNAPFYVLPASYSSYTSSTWTSFGSNFFIYGDCGADSDSKNVQWVLSSKTGVMSFIGSGNVRGYGNGTTPWYSLRAMILSAEFSEGITATGGWCFQDCSNLATVSLPSTLTIVSVRTFNATAITSIDIPEGVTRVDNYAFYNCTALEDVNLPSTLTQIGSNVFEGCTGLASIDLPEGLTNIGSKAFAGCTSLASITIPRSVTTISTSSGSYTFNGCTALRTVNWNAEECANFNKYSSDGKSFTYYTPFGNTKASITAFNFGPNVRVIPSCLCEGMTALTSVTLPSSVTTINQDVFHGCTGLTSVTIPAAVTSIGGTVFEGCTGITSVTSNAVNPPTISSNTFPTAVESAATLYVPANVTSRNAYTSDTYWREFDHILPYVITFDLQDHGDAIDPICVNAGRVDEALKPADPTETGYTFGGWFSNEGCTTPFTFGESTGTVVNADMTLYAKWTPSNYAITYKDQGNVAYSGSNVASLPGTHTYNSATALVDGVKTGYTFDGWFANSDCTGDAITSLGATDYTDDITLYAKWTINQYTVSFVSNGGSAVSSITQDYNSAVAAPADPTKTGYTFAGWSPAVPSVMPAENTECVAQWTINQYTVSFDSNGGSEVSSIKQNYNTEINAPANPTKTGYTFAGWSPAVPSVMPAENTECVAQWTINSYDVTFDLQGHGSAIAAQTIDYNGQVSEPSDPEADYYTFGGWYKEAGCANAWDFSEDQVTDDLTLYAKWTLNGLALDEGANNAPLLEAYDGQTTNVTMTRSLTNAQYNTFCLPFSLTADQMAETFGAGYDLEELTGVTYDGESLALEFTQREALEAGKPYLLQPANNAVNPSFSGVEISNAAPSDGLNNPYIEYRGVYSPALLEGGNHNLLFLGAGNELFWPASNGNLKGFRAYFIVKSPALGAMRARIVKKEDSATGIDHIQPSAVSSQKYIKDGILYIERDGKTFNAQGQRIK